MPCDRGNNDTSHCEFLLQVWFECHLNQTGTRRGSVRPSSEDIRQWNAFAKIAAICVECEPRLFVSVKSGHPLVRSHPKCIEAHRLNGAVRAYV